MGASNPVEALILEAGFGDGDTPLYVARDGALL